MTMDELKKELEEALRGIDYPAPRGKLITIAHLNGASAAVINRLNEFPETADFLNEEELREALGVTVHGEQPHGWE